MRCVLSCFGLLLLSAQAHADLVDLSLNSDAVRLQYVHEFQSNAMNLDAGGLYNSDMGSLLHAGFFVAGDASSGTNPVTAGVGARLVYTDGDLSNQSGFALPIGGFVRYSPQKANRFAIDGQIYFAPKVLSLGDAEKYEEYTIRFKYNVIHAADIYIGARYIKGAYKNAPDARFDTGMHIGATVSF
jgi:hypothetical protein